MVHINNEKRRATNRSSTLRRTIQGRCPRGTARRWWRGPPRRRSPRRRGSSTPPRSPSRCPRRSRRGCNQSKKSELPWSLSSTREGIYTPFECSPIEGRKSMKRDSHWNATVIILKPDRRRGSRWDLQSWVRGCRKFVRVLNGKQSYEIDRKEFLANWNEIFKWKEALTGNFVGYSCFTGR